MAGVLNALNADVLICGGIGGGAQTALAAAGIKLLAEFQEMRIKQVEAFINDTLDYNLDVKCSHHEHNHGEGHTCGEAWMQEAIAVIKKNLLVESNGWNV